MQLQLEVEWGGNRQVAVSGCLFFKISWRQLATLYLSPNDFLVMAQGMYSDRPEPTPLAIEAQKRRDKEEEEHRQRRLEREGGRPFFDGRYPSLTQREEDSRKSDTVLAGRAE